MTAPVQFCISNALVGQLRSNDDVIRSIYVSLYNFWLEWDTDMGWVPKCSSRQDASTDMRIDLFRSIRDLDLGWPEVKVTKWPFGVKKYMSRSALTRERRWCQNQRSISNSEEVIDEKLSRKTNPGNWTFLVWPRLARSTVDLNRSNRTPLDSERPKLSDGLCREALSHSGARWRGGWQPPPPPRCVLVWWKRRCGRGLKVIG